MSSSSRRRARQYALQGIYQWLLSGTDPALIKEQLAETPGFNKCDGKLFDRIWIGVTREFAALQHAFTPYLDRPAAEVSPVEKGILAIGAWELLHSPEVPYRVAINEAVELAKTYGGTDGHKYVNGVLDKMAAVTRTSEIVSR